MQQEIKTLDYTQIEPYFDSFLTEENRKVWSHFIVCNQYGTEQAHSEGYSGHGFSISRNPCFKIPYETGKTYVGSPEISISTGRVVMGIGVPIVRKDKTVGVVIGFVGLEHISQMLNSYQLTDNSYVFMLNNEGELCAHPDTGKVFQENWVTDDGISNTIKSVAVSMVNGQAGNRTQRSDGNYDCFSYAPIGETALSLCVVSPYKETYRVAIDTIFLLLMITVIFVTASAIGSLLIVRSMIHPVKWMEEQMYRFSAGIITVLDKK